MDWIACLQQANVTHRREPFLVDNGQNYTVYRQNCFVVALWGKGGERWPLMDEFCNQVSHSMPYFINYAASPQPAW